MRMQVGTGGVILKRVFKVIGIVFGGLVGLVLLAGVALALMSPSSRPAGTEKIEPTAERIAKGEYVFNSVAACAGCHSEHENSFGAPKKAGTLGTGQCANIGMGGSEMCIPNITPHPTAGVGGWTDGELVRAIREGIHRDGTALHPMMPFTHYRNMADEDVRAVVAYMRTLPPSETVRAPTPKPLPLKLIGKLLPKPVDGPIADPAADPLARGKYLVALGGCLFCHKGSSETSLTGGKELTGPLGDEVSADISPDRQKGLGRYTREQFVAMFKAMATVSGAPPTEGLRRAVMPWGELSGQTEADLGAMYQYLMSLDGAVTKSASR